MKKFILALTLAVTAASLASTAPAFARHGADDPAGHVRGEGGGHP